VNLDRHGGAHAALRTGAVGEALGEPRVQLLDRAAPIFRPNICQNLQKITLNSTNPTLQVGTFVETLRGIIEVIGSVDVLVGLAGAFQARSQRTLSAGFSSSSSHEMRR
jgi:hypothetical protein